MIRITSMRLAVLVLAAGLIFVLPASAAAKPKAKTKTELVTETFLLPNDLTGNIDQADAAPVCPKSTTLLSGGALSNTPVPVPTPVLDTEIYRSGPVGNAWYVRYQNEAEVDLQPSAQAICIKDKLKVKGLEGAGKSSAIASAAKAKAITKVTRVNTPFTLPLSVAPTNGHAQLDVACPEGTTIAGGGASFSAADENIELQESGPQGNGWHVRYDSDENDAVHLATAHALCLKNKLKVKGENDKARSKFEQVDLAVTLPPNATNTGRARFNVDCPEGTTIVGGGAKVSDAVAFAENDFKLEESGAVGNGWQVTMENDVAPAQSATISALCLKNKLKVK